MRVRSGRNAEETVLGVDSPKPAVVAHSYPGDIVAHALDFIDLVGVVLGGNKHCEVGLSASGRERRRNVLLRSVGIGNAEDKHMLCHPALVLAEVGRYPERETLLAEQNVSAVRRVDRNNRIVLGDVHNISLVGINVALSVQTLDKIAVLAKRVKTFLADAGHNVHIENYVNGIGYLDTDLREIAADNAHRIGDNVHRPSSSLRGPRPLCF